ncbi:hypothetical protein BCS58_25150, partial [Enterovibrio norvegicus]
GVVLQLGVMVSRYKMSVVDAVSSHFVQLLEFGCLTQSNTSMSVTVFAFIVKRFRVFRAPLQSPLSKTNMPVTAKK